MSFSFISSGKLIEYLDNGRFICGYVTDSQPKRVRLLNQNGREVNLPVSRIVHCSQASAPGAADRESLIRLLQDTTEKRHTLMQNIDLQMLWELACEESTDTFDPHFLTELMFGQVADDDRVSAFLRSVFKDKLFFKYREGKIQVHSPEKVEQLRLQQEREARKQEVVAQGSRLLKRIDQQESGAEPFSETEDEVLTILQEYYLHGSEADRAEMAREILKEAGFTKPHDPYHLLIKAGVWPRNVNLPLLKHNLPISFSTEARQQAEAILQYGSDSLFNDPARVDLTRLNTMTIDGATTLDFDDALSIEEQKGNYLVGVHISDVAHYVRPGDPLFQEALQRGTSLYFPEGQIPMLPRHLSQGVCSLIQGETRATLSHLILLSPEAEVLKTQIVPSIIRVARRLTYEDADTMIDSDPDLRLFNMLRKKLQQRRIEAGALLLPFPDVNIYVDPQGKAHVSLGKTDTPARTIISEMMILANTEAARFVSDRMAPGLFRSQGRITKRFVQGDDDDLFLNTMQRKHLPRSELTTEARPHSGLGVGFYTTVTSPIRRLLDLVMQHQINHLVRRRSTCFTEDMCKDFTSIISRTVATANNVKQQRHRYWLLKYLEERKDSYMDALVIETGPKRVNLLLTDIIMDIDLPATRMPLPEPGNHVKVRPVKVDPLDNSVRFDW
ncbi:ribonuclease catalytic domain-containing protein [Desulfofustis limnaeus]|jgi:exoribonuclease-2|uniref:Ribonuclease n=1 Tax=Desulfofustis limnaeus TaxID=2740163 RepID=A0ABM7W7U1_9BACT|nr:RNB domain-containing ribonuclease [Desulfofustis limnaeus]MDX9894689.1 RNB domain-containing ribonuclease [Desulfofustis sp.]BDD86945.1 ribonuclease [Desulfofustis limnaeus]